MKIYKYIVDNYYKKIVVYEGEFEEKENSYALIIAKRYFHDRILKTELDKLLYGDTMYSLSPDKTEEFKQMLINNNNLEIEIIHKRKILEMESLNEKIKNCKTEFEYLGEVTEADVYKNEHW